MEYHKINSVYNRYSKVSHPDLLDGVRYNEFIPGEFTLPEFEYLYDSNWIWTEKIDGTNIRIYVDHDRGRCYMRGRKGNAAIPFVLMEWFEDFFDEYNQRLLDKFPGGAVLYGEGVGPGIQKGNNYPNASVILFDVNVANLFLDHKAIEEISDCFNLRNSHVMAVRSLREVETLLQDKPQSYFGSFTIEGYVGVPEVPLFSRDGKRVITKVKIKDYVK